jgi:hypothetical protein
VSSATRSLVVSELSELKTGTSSKGKPWTLYKVTATDPDGKPIAESLTTFARLPIGEPVEVEVERREHPEYGASFTLKLPRAGGGLARRVDELERRVAALEQKAGRS